MAYNQVADGTDKELFEIINIALIDISSVPQAS